MCEREEIGRQVIIQDFLLQVQRRRSVLPHHLHSVMGSANLSLARGDLTGATELCMEVIRQGTCYV